MSKFRQPLPASVSAPAGWSAVPAPSSVLTQVPGENQNGPWVILLGFYTLTFAVPLAEMLIVYWHAHIPVVVIADLILTLGLIASGRVGEFLKTPLAMPWMAALVCFLFAAAFGLYPGRSVPFITEYGIRFHVFPFYCCAIAVSTKNVRHVFSWICWGSFLLLFLCLVYGQMDDGRLVIPSTDLANPNDLGLALLFMISSLLVPKSSVARILTTLALPLFVLEILKTGSRACLVTLLVLVGFVFVLVSTRTKIMMAVLVPIAMGVISMVVPSFTLTRLTLFADPDKVYIADDQLRGAAYSQMARTDLQRRAIDLTIHHPLFGVGAQMFEDAVEGMVRTATGQKSAWQGAHNTYLEIAAENGIPAFIFYTWCILLCLKMNYRAYKLCQGRPELGDMAMQSLALLLATLAFAVCTFFSNNAYDAHACVLVGLSAASSLALKRELQGVEQLA